MSIASASSFAHSLEHIIGFLLVLFALSLLWAVTAILGKLFTRMAVLAPEAAPAPVPSGPEGPSEEEVVAITAVVASLMGRRSRIVSIRSGGAKDWNREGRREHFASHRIR